MRIIANFPDHLGIHLHLTRRAFFLGIHNAAGDHQFDPIGTLTLQLIDMSFGFLDRIGNDRHRTGHVATRYGNAFIGSDDARTGILALQDLITDPCVHVPQTADRTDRRHAAEQLQSGVILDHAVGDDRTDRIGEDQSYQFRIVALLLLRFAIPCQMDMHIDQTRHDIRTIQIDVFIAWIGHISIDDVDDVIIAD